MKIWKRGMALLTVLTLAIGSAACKKRTLDDAESWEDAVEICLGKYGVDVCEMEGDSLHVMIRSVEDEQAFIADCSALATCFHAQASGKSAWKEIDTLMIGMHEGGPEQRIGILGLFYKKDPRVPFGLISILSSMHGTKKSQAVIAAYDGDPLFSLTDGRKNYGWKMELYK